MNQLNLWHAVRNTKINKPTVMVGRDEKTAADMKFKAELESKLCAPNYTPTAGEISRLQDVWKRYGCNVPGEVERYCNRLKSDQKHIVIGL
jgi:hypothetical protein